MPEIAIPLNLTSDEAWCFSQLVKRLSSHNLGTTGHYALHLVTPAEHDDAKKALRKLEKALAAAGYDPR